MPTIGRWDDLPENVRQHLIDRMRDRAISLADLSQLRLWIESQPEVPERGLVQGFRLIQNLRPRLVPQDLPSSRPCG
jgi:hypothetical protein